MIEKSKPASSERPNGDAGKSGVRILLLEDDPNDAFLLQAALAHDFAGIRLVHAKNRTEFLAALKEGSFDVILADGGLACFSGLDALKVAREQDAKSAFICVSGLADQRHIKACLDAGANAYVNKDHLGELPAVIRELIASKSRLDLTRQ